MRDNAQIDEGKLIELLTKAFEQARKLLFVSVVRNAAEAEAPLWLEAADAAIVAAADALARRSIQEQPETVGSLHVLFDGPPSHESGRFVEVEDDSGKSVRAGEWVERPNGLWDLVIPRYAPPPIAGAGWKVVPIEPTEAMLIAGCDAAHGWPTYADQSRTYTAMLAASPVPDNTDARGAQVKELIAWLRKRGEPDSGINYTSNYFHTGVAYVEFRGSDATFAADHFHGQNARDLADALSAIIPGTDASGVIEP